jgi:hypothetical protein
MIEYKIIKNQYINERGKELSPYYTIRYKVRFLWFWWRWKYVSHSSCDRYGCSSLVTDFPTLEDAQRFAEKFICGGRVYDGFEKRVVDYKICK